MIITASEQAHMTWFCWGIIHLSGRHSTPPIHAVNTRGNSSLYVLIRSWSVSFTRDTHLFTDRWWCLRIYNEWQVCWILYHSYTCEAVKLWGSYSLMYFITLVCSEVFWCCYNYAICKTFYETVSLNKSIYNSSDNYQRGTCVLATL